MNEFRRRRSIFTHFSGAGEVFIYTEPEDYNALSYKRHRSTNTVFGQEFLSRLFLRIIHSLLFEDNQSCIKLLQNEKSSHTTKHVATKFHFVRDLYKSKELDVKYCPSERMIADLLTKPLEAVKTRKFTLDIGLI